ncbi:hypothetical protein Pan216_38860 [Planctomycetes bacterium Pan216]|uniref:Uncharacterized protein n=1 Tax=Kolteria novifilia TaxID=2527975 RepID=A0A518B7T0_9BACT|nr:hypothetical protein Pan216_38860 [Planctomycetes bacterium Pan216]
MTPPIFPTLDTLRFFGVIRISLKLTHLLASTTLRASKILVVLPFRPDGCHWLLVRQ